MRLRADGGALAGTWTATLTTDHPSSSYGVPVLLVNGEPVGTLEAHLAGYRLVEGTDEERKALSRAGYNFPEA